MKIKQVIREHRSIAILFGFELLVLIWAFCLLFGERTVIDINPEILIRAQSTMVSCR